MQGPEETRGGRQQHPEVDPRAVLEDGAQDPPHQPGHQGRDPAPDQLGGRALHRRVRPRPAGGGGLHAEDHLPQLPQVRPLHPAAARYFTNDGRLLHKLICNLFWFV